MARRTRAAQVTCENTTHRSLLRVLFGGEHEALTAVRCLPIPPSIVSLRRSWASVILSHPRGESLWRSHCEKVGTTPTTSLLPQRVHWQYKLSSSGGGNRRWSLSSSCFMKHVKRRLYKM